MTKFLSKTLLLLGLMAVSACNLSQKSTQESDATATANLSAESEIIPSEIKENLEFLSSNDLKGRATGSEGINKAAK
ncbi:MAG TPA: hypothetical protein VK941_12545, partial [Gillisia sp.]|nr:hypothetical protein [Gillisia sp.]